MKLMTLNTHSLQEENYLQKLEWFIDWVGKEKPDLIALQEVNQTCDADFAEAELWEGLYAMPVRVPLRQDNHAAQVVYHLRRAGIFCWWAWLPIKRGYGKYDEGTAILSIGRKILRAESFFISRNEDYENWRTRAVLGVQLEGMEDWFYSVHMGWWDDKEEPFLKQWEILEKNILEKHGKNAVWLMGDFNAPDTVSDESYGHIRNSGWMDTHCIAEEKKGKITVSGRIDGWKEKKYSMENGIRLDYIWYNHRKKILSSKIVFDGKKEPVISDHFGVLIEVKEK